MVKIIAEAGVNHNGCVETAIQMIKVAKMAGADAIKFQTFKAENLVIEDAQQDGSLAPSAESLSLPTVPLQEDIDKD